jgi:alkylated DNA repair dioxygenase AlkB
MRTDSAAPDLFGAPALPAGLDYEDAFIAPADEAWLLEALARLPFREATFRQYTARRRVVRFGDGDDDTGASDAFPGRSAQRQRDEYRTSPPAPWPEWLDHLRARVAARQRVAPEAFVHGLVTEYRPGTPIGWHRDRPRYGIVVGLSLGGAVRMRFRPCERPNDRAAVIALELVPRSLYVMQGEVRWRWQHSIPPAKALRYSITLRTLADVATSRAPPSASRA